MPADALSDVLRTVRLTGATFFDVVAKAPCVAEQPPREMLLPKILPSAEHLIAYHVLTEGRCVANIVGKEPIAIEAGVGAAERRRQYRHHRRRDRLRIGGCVQPRVQEGGRRAAVGLASAARTGQRAPDHARLRRVPFGLSFSRPGPP
jgi:hypothetical protein